MTQDAGAGTAVTIMSVLSDLLKLVSQQGFSNDICISRGKTRNLIGQWHYFKPV
jgi:hypothetical protein